MQVSALVAGLLLKWTISDQEKFWKKKNNNYKDMQNEHKKK